MNSFILGTLFILTWGKNKMEILSSIYYAIKSNKQVWSDILIANTFYVLRQFQGYAVVNYHYSPELKRNE